MQQGAMNPYSGDCAAGDAGVLACISSQVWRSLSDPRAFDVDEALGLLDATHEEHVEASFEELVREWKDSRPSTSFVSILAMHPAYQRIIGLGKPALPFILRELDREPDHWFWALKAISGEDPVPARSRGNMPEMIAAWLAWGRENGYAR
jgi:hypothetical protein